MNDLVDTVLGELRGVLTTVDEEQLAGLTSRLAGARRVFVTGEGRSGFMAKAFAMRLMHLGWTVHVVGETTTPAVAGGDTLVAVSGSGTTAATVRVAEQARRAGAGVLAVTTAAGSPLAEQAVHTLVVPAATKHRRAGEAASVQPLSSLFDQATHVLLDVVCLRLAPGGDEALARHANTE
ncbi:6-phospho-3-hexuloisomerase [Prauserella muralis]|uniref:6-phospho 3-hexuloisomerase n=1 Tax=Prauserella muralis TaxID=588067 RepID=A0A2V4B0D3_9PSEU|nr:6-phospho-3-hexuloisomerase [Prauserella muralis]PXY27720.1 6-phospho 3-hexuloisomerase [Prauserella muralis]TWE22533.1 6-phospho-3-hexuloisomerase [Prauserella muralis]